MSWIAKNQTGSPITITDLGNVIIPASSQLDLTNFGFERLIRSEDLKTAITNNLIIINDGAIDLSKTDSTEGVTYYTKKQTLQNEVDIHVEQSDPKGFSTIADTTISFSNGSMTFSITPISSSFRYWIDGVKYIKNAVDSVAITDNEGMWYIYYAGSTLTASQTLWNFASSIATVCSLYWDSTNKKQIYLSDERHTTPIHWAIHRRLHMINNLQYEKNNFTIGNYLLRQNGSLDSHCQFSLTNGVLYDEDLRFSIVNSATPANPFEQKLSTIANIPLFYRSGTSNWRRIDATNFAVAYDGVNPIKYNLNTAGSWSLVSATNGNFIDMWLVATTDPNNPIVCIVGQSQRTNVFTPLSDYSSILNNIPFSDFTLLQKLTFKTLTTYANTPKAILYDISVSSIVITGTGIDRANFIASYNGNAGVGKWLEIYHGQGSDTQPFTFVEPSFIRTITIQVTAASTGIISCYKLPDTTNAVFTISLTGQLYLRQDYSSYFSADDQIAFKVSSGSFAKPALMIWVQTDLS